MKRVNVSREKCRAVVDEDKMFLKNVFFFLTPQIFGCDIICLVPHSVAVRVERRDGKGGTYKCHEGFCASPSHVCDTHNPFQIRTVLTQLWKHSAHAVCSVKSMRVKPLLIFFFFTPTHEYRVGKLTCSKHAKNLQSFTLKLSGAFVQSPVRRVAQCVI